MRAVHAAVRGAGVCLVVALAACASSGAETTAPSTTAVPLMTTATTSSPSTSTTTTTSPPPATTTTPGAPGVHPVTAEELGASWHEGCPVGPDQLRRITVTYVGFDGVDHIGELIVHADWADALVGVFDRIHATGFPITRMVPIDAYGGSDDASMADDNTSAFNCRPVTDGTGWSRHAYGRAIDINPIENPYIRCNGTFLPPDGEPYTLDRSGQPGQIVPGDAVVQAFAAIGWRWGGDWACPSAVDYQHFDHH